MSLLDAILILHVLGATVLFGTGMGIAFFMLMAYRSANVNAFALVTRHVVIADILFTLTAVVAQPVTGTILAMDRGYPMFEGWIGWSLILYIITGLCWLPVVWLQYRLRDMAADAAAAGQPLPARAHRYMRLWFMLGWPAFLAVAGIIVLMVLKPAP